MAVITGTTGSVAFSGTGGTITANAISWRLRWNKAVQPATVYGATQTTGVLGLTSWSGEITCRLDDTVMPAAAAAAGGTITLTQSTGKAYSGTALFTDYNTDHSHDGQPTITISFAGNGALTFPT